MKTNQLILAAVALTALAACTKDGFTASNTSDDEIGFNAVTQRSTKANDAIISGAAYGTDNTFQVWGWQSQAGDFSEFSAGDASNFMSNLTISWNKGHDNGRAEAWRNAANYYYWPLTGKISFLAVHPSTVAPTTTGWDATNKKPQATVANYAITPGTNETVDLMFATNEGSRRSTALPMVFNHALSQIEVKVKTNDDYSSDVAFDVESVEFNNIDLSGDVAYANEAFTWTNNDAQTQDWTYYGTVLEDITDSYQVYGAAKVNIPQPANDDKSKLDPSDPEYDALDKGTTITIGYSMEQYGSAKITGTVTIADPVLSVTGKAWEAGKKYVYTLNFNLNEILFAPEVTDWVDADVTTINILD